jgi:16S rRNA (cytidine1402-2'-O)-methyltransferase
MGTLYVIATPIGNLGDITTRAVEILKEVDLIACEDTRVTRKLLESYRINIQTTSYHQHSRLTKTNYLMSLLRSGKSIALVSDAGTPGISDPGGKLIEKIYEKNRELRDKIEVVSVPGPSALTAAISVSGLPCDRFIFLGFLPQKKGRQKIFEEIKSERKTVVFYESPYRVVKTLKKLTEVLDSERTVVVCRELTKRFEEVVRGSTKEVASYFLSNPSKVKGEFVVLVSGEGK